MDACLYLPFRKYLLPLITHRSRSTLGSREQPPKPRPASTARTSNTCRNIRLRKGSGNTIQSMALGLGTWGWGQPTLDLEPVPEPATPAPHGLSSPHPPAHDSLPSLRPASGPGRSWLEYTTTVPPL